MMSLWRLQNLVEAERRLQQGRQESSIFGWFKARNDGDISVPIARGNASTISEETAQGLNRLLPIACNNIL